MMKLLNNKIRRFNNDVMQEPVPFYKKKGDDCGVEELYTPGLIQFKLFLISTSFDYMSVEDI